MFLFYYFLYSIFFLVYGLIFKSKIFLKEFLLTVLK